MPPGWQAAAVALPIALLPRMLPPEGLLGTLRCPMMRLICAQSASFRSLPHLTGALGWTMLPNECVACTPPHCCLPVFLPHHLHRGGGGGAAAGAARGGRGQPPARAAAGGGGGSAACGGAGGSEAHHGCRGRGPSGRGVVGAATQTTSKTKQGHKLTSALLFALPCRTRISTVGRPASAGSHLSAASSSGPRCRRRCAAGWAGWLLDAHVGGMVAFGGGVGCLSVMHDGQVAAATKENDPSVPSIVPCCPYRLAAAVCARPAALLHG